MAEHRLEGERRGLHGIERHAGVDAEPVQHVHEVLGGEVPGRSRREGAAADAAGAAVEAADAGFQRRMERAPEWFCSFLAGNSREKSRLRREMATMKGSVVWLVQQRRQGTWSAEERAHLRDVMRSASSVSPYLFIWVIPGSMLLLPFMAWFLDKQRKRRGRKLLR